MLKYILKNWVRCCGRHSYGSGDGEVTRLYVHGNAPLVSKFTVTLEESGGASGQLVPDVSRQCNCLEGLRLTK